MFSVPTLHGGLSKLILQDLPNLSFNGTIQKAILDQGSIYIGGSFTNITNITTKKSQNFTILNKDTSVISAISRIYFNSTVYCSAIDGDYIYIGGAFTSFNETAKNRIIKIHIPTGTIDSSFNIGSGFNNVLYSILVDGNDLYIGGSFTTYNSINRNYLAKINKNTGNLDTTFSIGTKLNGTVRTLAIDGDNLYVGGDFTTYNSLGRNRIIKIDKNTSNEISSFTIGTGFDNNVYSIKLDTDNVYVGGMFGFYKSTGRKYIAKISKADATLDTTFNTGTGFDYHVYSIELDGNDLYVGGGFSSYKSTTRQYIAKINKTDASLDTTFDSSVGFNNAVVSIALDGNNLYAGGLFTTYKGATRQYIAKINKNTALEIDSSGSGFSSTVGFDNAVRSIVVSGNNLYMGGDFTRYKNDSFFTRNYIVKINAVTKTVDPTFDPGTGFNTTVRALAIDGDDLYVGGDFISYKGIVRNYLAKINKNTANEIDSNGVGFSTDVGFDAAIYSLFINDSSVYMGGNFTTYKGTARKYIAKISKVDATLDSSFDTSSGFDNQVSSIVIEDNFLYASGFFTTYKGIARRFIAKINKNTAALDISFDTTTGCSQYVNSILLNQNDIYAVGNFTSYQDPSVTKSSYSALLDKADASLVSSVNKTTMDNSVYCSIQDGTYTYLGGAFTTYNGYLRNRIVKITTLTGEVDTAFDPGSGFNGIVRSLAIDANNLYVGGSFTSYKGNPRAEIVKLDKVTANEVDTAGSNFSGGIGFSGGGGTGVRSLLIDNNNLYAAGDFTSFANNDIKKSERATLINKTDASISSLIPKSWCNGVVYCSVADGDYIYVGGNFTVFNGFTANRLVKIHIPTGTVDATFNVETGFNTNVQCLAIDGDNLYVGGDFTSYKGTYRSYLVKINKNTALEVDSANTGFSIGNTFGGSVYSIVVDGSSLYVGGSFLSYKGSTRQRLVKINKTDATIDTTFNTASGFSSIVRSIVIDGSNLIVGGEFTTYKGATRQRIVKINKNTAVEINEGRTTYALLGTFLSISKDNGATWTNKTISDGLNTVDASGIYAAGSSIYIAAYDNGIFLSKDRGTTWINKTTANGLISNSTTDIFASGNSIYVATFSGLSISTDGGTTWTNKTTANGLVSNQICRVYGYSSNIYLATYGGLSISTDGGTTWTNKTTANGIISNNINDVFISAGKIYLGTDSGLSISTDGGVTWTNKTTANGLVDNLIKGVYVSGNNIYLATYSGISISTDSGTTWTSSFSNYTNSIYANPPYVYAASEYYGAWFSNDNGLTWTQGSQLSDNNGNMFDSVRDIFAFDNGFYTISGFNNNVYSLAIDGNDLYVGGNFTGYRDKTRSCLVKIDKNTATEIYAENDGFSITNSVNNTVFSIAIDGSDLYLGGGFTTCKGTTRQYVTKINKNTAVLDSIFNTSSGFDNNVLSITNTNYGLYAGGNFLSYKGNSGVFTRNDIVKINKSTGVEVDANNTGFSTTSGFNGLISTLGIDGNNLYVGGNFTTYKGSTANYLARIDKANATEVAPYVTNMLNGQVNSLLIDQDSIYAGGNFNNVYDASSLRSVRAALVNKTDASFVSSVIKSYVGGTVYCSIVDGDYVYIGGDFNSYNDVFVNRIAKIYIPTGAIDTTFVASASFNNIVYTLAIDGDNLYAGGSFSSRLLKISKTTGSIDNGFAAYPSADVSSIAIDGNDLYVAGGFFAFNGKNIRYAVKINKTTGALDANDSFNISTRLGGVNCFYIDSTSIYMGGSFAKYVDLNSAKSLKGALISKTDASLVSSVIKSYFNDAVYCSVVDGNYIYVGGDFTIYNGTVRNRIAKIDIQTGALDTTFDPGLGFDKAVRCIVIDGTNLYVGGEFNSYKGTFQYNLAKINKTTAAQVDPNGSYFSSTFMTFYNGNVYSLAIDGTNLYVGGDFTGYRDPTTSVTNTRQSIIKINKNTAAEVDTSGTGFSTTSAFNGTVLSLLVDGTNLYVGGSFTTYKGNARYRLVKINKTTAAEVDTSGTGFSKNNQLDGTVRSLLIDGTALCVAGNFNSYTDPSTSVVSTRQNLMKINKDTGVLDTTFDTSIGFVYSFYGSSISSIVIDGTNLYAGGFFSTYKANSRSFIVKINKNTAAEVDTSGTGFSNFGLFDDDFKSVATISNTNYGLFVGGSFYSHKNEGLTRQSLVKINKTDATVDTAFNTSSGFDSQVNSIAIDGNNLYACGYFTTYKTNTRQYIVKIDKNTAAEVDTSGTGFSTTSGFNNAVRSFLIDGTSLYVGGDFTTYKGTARTRMVKISKTDATLDATFDTSSGFNNTVYSVANTNYGIYGFGSFTLYKNDGNYTRQYLAKINKTTSTVDTAFNTSSGFNGIVNSIVLDGNNLYAGGSFTTYKSLTRRYIAKIDKTTASEVDTSGTGFSTTTGFNNTIRSLTVSSNGLQAGGDFTNYKSNGLNTRDRVLKINKNTAALDSSFYVGVGTSGFNAEARCIVLIGDYLYIGGAFTSYASNTRQYIAKIHKDTAALNSTFNTISGFNNNVNDILVYTTDTIFTVGAFTTYKSASRNYNIFIETKDATVSPKKFKIG